MYADRPDGAGDPVVGISRRAGEGHVLAAQWCGRRVGEAGGRWPVRAHDHLVGDGVGQTVNGGHLERHAVGAAGREVERNEVPLQFERRDRLRLLEPIYRAAYEHLWVR